MMALVRLCVSCLLVFFCSLCLAKHHPHSLGDGGPLPILPQRTICGSNDMVDMSAQDEALKQMGRPVGIYRGGGLACTGTLVSEDLFLTNRHCKVSCSSIKVSFGYLSRQSVYACKEIVEAGSSASNQDYMLVRLEGNPGKEWGFYRLSARELTSGTPLLMIHHPGANPMKVSQKNCTFSKEASGLLHHRCDTNPGSSGTGVLLPDYENPANSKIVSLHAFGGCDSGSTSTNSGPSIKHLATISSEIRALVDDY